MSVLHTFSKLFLIGASSVLFSSPILFGVQNRAGYPTRPEAIPVTVSPYGFAQADLAVSAGSYLFVVINRTGFDEISVYLERMSGNSLTDPPIQLEFSDAVKGGKKRLTRNANLTRGTYRLRVANRPAWVCAIHVN
jgi:hypothetical protein